MEQGKAPYTHCTGPPLNSPINPLLAFAHACFGCVGCPTANPPTDSSCFRPGHATDMLSWHHTTAGRQPGLGHTLNRRGVAFPTSRELHPERALPAKGHRKKRSQHGYKHGKTHDTRLLPPPPPPHPTPPCPPPFQRHSRHTRSVQGCVPACLTPQSTNGATPLLPPTTVNTHARMALLLWDFFGSG